MINRAGNIITTFIDGTVTRVEECRNVASAIDLEMKLTADPAFAAQWAEAPPASLSNGNHQPCDHTTTSFKGANDHG
jgi:hypothetical protein